MGERDDASSSWLIINCKDGRLVGGVRSLLLAPTNCEPAVLLLLDARAPKEVEVARCGLLECVKGNERLFSTRVGRQWSVYSFRYSNLVTARDFAAFLGQFDFLLLSILLIVCKLH
jgi:hypothetical protein